jgi:CubicO group peptidase (beta-lactamase class C family)
VASQTIFSSGARSRAEESVRSAGALSAWSSIDVDWDGDLKEMPSAASGLRLRPRDLAKFGSLYLHDGRWRDHQILPADWVNESTRRHLATGRPVSAYGSHGYGYHWWNTCYRTGFGTFEASVAAGNGQQRIYILPAVSVVVTVLAGRYNDPSAQWLPERLLIEHILPAVRMPADAGFKSEPAGCATGPRDALTRQRGVDEGAPRLQDPLR